jgi:hypothetical protein
VPIFFHNVCQFNLLSCASGAEMLDLLVSKGEGTSWDFTLLTNGLKQRHPQELMVKKRKKALMNVGDCIIFQS